MAKIVSLHMESCSYDCPNVDVCYHRAKTSTSKTVEVLPPDFRVEMLNKGWTIHESVCSQVAAGMGWILLNKYTNYNITIPFPLLSEGLKQFAHQLQVTIYTVEQAREIPEIQKLYLIKNDNTFEYALDNFGDISYIHFCINQKWITRKAIQKLMYAKMVWSRTNPGITIDSCWEGCSTNHVCSYNSGDYIDITFDGTLRTCPFNKVGVPIDSVYNGTYESLFTLRTEHEFCKFTEWYGSEEWKTHVGSLRG